MFDFLDADWFNISLEVIFLVLMYFDVKKYIITRRQEYLLNIVLTIGFAIWTAIPFYNKYITWSDSAKKEYMQECIKSENNVTLCECLDDAIFKEYSFKSYTHKKESNEKSLNSFIEESIKECKED